VLNPSTIPVLQQIPKERVKSILDLGCGLGYTTTMLADVFQDAQRVVGLEYNAALVEGAQA
jgi:trans-aconitate methyltransferase